MSVSSAATSAFLPVIAEMKQPEDYNKAVYLCMSFVILSYLAFTLVLYITGVVGGLHRLL